MKDENRINRLNNMKIIGDNLYGFKNTETDEEINIKIKKIMKEALELLMSDRRLRNGEELTKISIRENSIWLFTGRGSRQEIMEQPVVEDPDMDRESLENFVSQYPRLRIIDPIEEKRIKTETKLKDIEILERKVDELGRSINANETNQDLIQRVKDGQNELRDMVDTIMKEVEQDIEEDKNFYEQNGYFKEDRKYYLAEVKKQSESVDIVKKIIYLDKSLESEQDSRIESEKMAEYQAESNTDYTLHQMIKHKYTEGMLTELDKSAYGYDEQVGNYVKLGTNEQSTDFQQAKVLAFKKLNYPIKENTLPRSNVIFFETRVSENVVIDRDLARIFDTNKKGIIILDKLLPSDLLRSNAFKEDEIRTIHNMGVGISHDNPTLVVTNEGSNAPTEDSIRRLKAGKFAAILDTNRMLTAEQVLELSQTQLVVLNWSLTRIESTFNSILLEMKHDEELYGRFIDNILYLGDFKGAKGEKLTQTSSKLLKDRKFNYFGEIVNRQEHLMSLLKYLHGEDIEEIGVKNNTSYAIKVRKDEDGQIKRQKLTPTINERTVRINRDNIINLLWKVIATGEPGEMIKKLDVEMIYNFIFEMSTVFTTISEGETKITSKKDRLIKITVYNTGRDLDLIARRLPESIPRNQLVDSESKIIEILGSSRMTHSRLAKAYLEANHDDKRILIIDEDYIFDVLEYKKREVDQVIVLRELDKVSIPLVDNFDPHIVICNFEYDAQKIADIIRAVDIESAIIFTGIYPIVEYLEKGIDKTFENIDVIDRVKRELITMNAMDLIMHRGKVRAEDNPVLQDIDTDEESKMPQEVETGEVEEITASDLLDEEGKMFWEDEEDDIKEEENIEKLHDEEDFAFNKF